MNTRGEAVPNILAWKLSRSGLSTGKKEVRSTLCCRRGDVIAYASVSEFKLPSLIMSREGRYDIYCNFVNRISLQVIVCIDI